MFQQTPGGYSTEIDLNAVVSRSGARNTPRRRIAECQLPDHAADMLARLAPREREVATIVYTHGMISAEEARTLLAKPLSNSAIRSMLSRLEAKGILRKRKAGNRHLFGPVLPDHRLREQALRRLCNDYFGGSLLDAALALVEMTDRAENLSTRGPAAPFELVAERPAGA